MRRRMIWIRRCAGLLLVVSVFSPLSTGLGASPTLPVPRAGGYLRVLTNVNQGLPAYSGYLGPEALLTDLEFQYGQNSPVQNYAQVKSWFTAHFPKAQLGTYCSSRALVPASSQQFNPPNCLTPNQFAESELLPPTFTNEGLRIVDYRQSAARAKLVAGLVQQAKTAQVKWLYADNWSHPSTWAGYIAWSDTMTYMKQLHTALAAQGIGLICNVAIDPSAVSTADMKLMGGSCEAVSLEMAAVPTATADAAALARLVAGYQALQSAGCKVILIPNYNLPQTALNEAQFEAALALILDNSWVAYPFWMPPQDWFKWPGQMGIPSGVIKQNGTTLYRDMKNGSVQIDGVKRTVTLTWKRYHNPNGTQDDHEYLRQRFWPLERALLASRRRFGFEIPC
jgi:hypothetical protein